MRFVLLALTILKLIRLILKLAPILVVLHGLLRRRDVQGPAGPAGWSASTPAGYRMAGCDRTLRLTPPDQ